MSSPVTPAEKRKAVSATQPIRSTRLFNLGSSTTSSSAVDMPLTATPSTIERISVMPITPHSPQNLFRDLAQLSGSRPWNNNQFDNHWLLQTNGVWKMSNNQTTPRVSATMDEHKSSAELPEVINLNDFVRELLGPKMDIISWEPYPPDVLRHRFYQRVFGNGDRTPMLASTKAGDVFVHRDNVVTTEAILAEMLSVIELLIEDMIRVRGAPTKSVPRVIQWLQDTALPEQTYESQQSVPSGTLQGDIRPDTARLGSAAPHPGAHVVGGPSSTFGVNTQAEPALRHPQQSERGLTGTGQPASQIVQSQSTVMPAYDHHNLGPQTQSSASGQNAPMAHPQPQSAQQPSFLPTHGAPMPPTYVTAGQVTVGQSFSIPGPSQLQYQQAVPPHMLGSQMQYTGPGFPPAAPQGQYQMPPQAQWQQYQQPQWPMPAQTPWQTHQAQWQLPTQASIQGGYSAFPLGQTPLQGGYSGFPSEHVQSQLPTIPQPHFQSQMPGIPVPFPQQQTVNPNNVSNALGTMATPNGSVNPALRLNTPALPESRPVATSRTNRRASSSRPGGRSSSTKPNNESPFSIAHWAQTNRPATPPGAPTHAQAMIRDGIYVGSMGTTAPTPDLQMLSYRPGSDAMYPRASIGPSTQLQNLTNQGAPALPVMTNPSNMPIGVSGGESRPAQWGVVKIGNIPYGLTKQEVLAFLGKNAKIVTPDLGSPIHIVMDRLTGKTMDCYVEFFSVGDAQAAVNAKTRLGSIHKLGDRVAVVEMSSQDELMKELFPKAKQVDWQNGVPVVIETDEPFNSGFKNFVSGEELVMLVKHAEFPQRSTYTARCPQRCYESMISTLHKLPWYAPHLIALKTRNALFEAVRDQIRILVSTLKKITSYSIMARNPVQWSATYGNTGLTHALLEELLLAGLNAAGFSERQRWELVTLAEWAGDKVRISPLSRVWPFECVGRKAGVEEDVVEYYINHLTAHLIPSNPLSVRSSNPFRTFSVPPHPKPLGITVAEMGAYEMDFVLRLYGYMLPQQQQ